MEARSERVVFENPRAKAVGGRAPWVEPLSDPWATQQRHGRAGEASSPAARESCGPPAPGAHPCE
eukprot:12869521-Alexandrium_andersonii.AAC.1